MGGCFGKRSPQHHNTRSTITSRSKKTLHDDRKIVIIGAGVAGLACAIELKNHGFQNVRILEMSDRIGGRVRTIKFADSYVDLGAQWVYGKYDNTIYKMVQNLRLLDVSDKHLSNVEWIRSNGEVLREPLVEQILNIVDTIYRELPKKFVEADETFFTYFENSFREELAKSKYSGMDKKHVNELLRAFRRMEGNLEDMNALKYSTYEACQGPRFMNWRDQGFKRFLQEICKGDDLNPLGLLKNCIKFNQQVVKIDWDRPDRTVLIYCTDSHYLADHLVITVSLGVLKRNAMTFTPVLPARKVAAIKGLGFGSVCKIFLEYEVPFWPEGWSGFTALWREEDLENIKDKWVTDIYGFQIYAYQPRVLLGWASGPYVELIESLDNNQLIQGVKRVLHKFLPNSKIPYPKNLMVSKWSTDPAHKGSFSYPSSKSKDYHLSPQQLGEPINIRFNGTDMNLSDNKISSYVGADLTRPLLLFAGEATSPTHYSTVHGALESGIREALRLVVYYQG